MVFNVKRSTISEIIKAFAECDRSPIKNFTDGLNLGELQVDDISAKYTTKDTKKYTPIR